MTLNSSLLRPILHLVGSFVSGRLSWNIRALKLEIYKAFSGEKMKKK